MSSFYHERQIRNTRKTRACYWCGEPIAKGCSAVGLTGKFEGDFWYGTMHNECCDALHDCEQSLDGFESYQQRRGLTQAQTDAAQDYFHRARAWLDHRQKSCSRHVLPVRNARFVVKEAGADG